MIARVVILIVAFLILTFLAFTIRFDGDTMDIALVAGTVICGISIFEEIRTYHRFQLHEKLLVVKSPFRETITINIDEVVRWKVLSYWIRGQEKKSLVLLISFDKQIVLSNNDSPSEYERIYQYLNSNLAKVQEI